MEEEKKDSCETKETEAEAKEDVKEDVKEEKQEAEVNEGTETEESGSEKEEAEDNKEGKEEKPKKGLFGKNKDSEKEKLKEENAELKDKLLRQMAEFDNFRKRNDKEKDAMFEAGAKSVIEKILPVVDNFERGFSSVESEDEDDPFTKGMRMVFKELTGELEKLDVKPIEAVGKEFDPELHNAVMHVDDESLGENIVAEELQKGYTYRGSVVRHSMVKVAN